MKLISSVWREFKSIYDLYMLSLVAGVGMIVFFLDRNNLKRMGLKKEALFAKWLGAAYMVLSVGLYIAARYF